MRADIKKKEIIFPFNVYNTTIGINIKGSFSNHFAFKRMVADPMLLTI
ncbi:MAG TPA: hypothetical protein VJL83_04170 [Patescibacteria group bacterium]|nr:hypothetical protein [Patescibacteria group bacterium]